jgi:hypothetical protein
MRTGWTSKHPTSLSEYDEQHRTITMESWMSNRGKFNYPVTPENIHLFRQMLREVSLSSPHWDEYPHQQELPSIEFPKSYGRTRANGEDEEEVENDDYDIFDQTEDNAELQLTDDEDDTEL